MSCTATCTIEDLSKMESSSQYNWGHGRAPLPLPFQSRATTSNNDSLLPPPPPISHSSLITPYYAPSSTFRPTYSSYQYTSPPLLSSHATSTPARPPLITSNSYPSLKRSHRSDSQYDVHASNSREVYEPAAEQDSAKSTIDANHRLLSFTRSARYRTVHDQHGRPSTFDISAQLHGMFFLSEIATNAGDLIVIQPELTCYRRNLFQISGSVSGPSGPVSVEDEGGELRKIVEQELTVSAIETVDNSAVRLVVIPWKTQPPNAPESSSNRESHPAPIPIFRGINDQDIEADLTVQNIAWRRLQFRVATANNGRRRELQQHFIVRLTLKARLDNGTKVILAENVTTPVVVRGRSPRNFQYKKEVPLSRASSSMQSGMSPPKRRISAPPPAGRLIKPTSIELPRLPLLCSGPSYPPSPMVIDNAYGKYGSWSSTQTDHTAVGTPPYPPPVSLLNSYGHATSPTPDSPIIESPASYSTNEAARDQYTASSTSSFPLRMSYQSPASSMDDNPRPSKSPRHKQIIESATDYPGFEQRLNVTSNYEGDHKDYLPPILPPQRTWSPAERTPISMLPPPTQHYTFPQEGYHIKQEPNTTNLNNYTWRQ